MRKVLLPFIYLFPIYAISQDANLQNQAQSYLDTYSKQFQQLFYADELAQWKMNTHIVKGDTVSQAIADAADNALAKFTGSKENIDSARKYLALAPQLNELQVRQLKVILFYAAGNPATAGEIVDRRIKESNSQASLLYGFRYSIDGKPVTTGYIDSILTNSTDLTERLKAWKASKEVGKVLKAGVDSLQYLRNACVTPLGYKDYFDYTAMTYQLKEKDIINLTQQFIRDVWPLYRELHTWARYELAKKYKQPVPDYIPAQWLPNRWGQNWSELENVKALNIDSVLKQKGVEWMAHESERFYKSVGFKSLPASFWAKSSLYPVPANADYTKNNHAFAWHLDLDSDVRSIQSITPTTDYWSTVLHEFGHIFYFLSYSNPNVPILLRDGANPGFHEAFGSMMGLASLQKPFLENLSMVKKGVQTNDTLELLKEALKYIVEIPWGSGVMTEFEYDLYAKNLPEQEYNSDWWRLVKKYQGIVPPEPRGEEYCDAASKTHITDVPAIYYNYSVANVLIFQFHEFIADSILHQDPHATNYWGNQAVGDFLKSIMKNGATIEWQKLLSQTIHSELSAQSMIHYFSPLMVYLKKENEGRTYTLPEKISFPN